MLKLKRGTAWTVLQAALMSAGPLFASEQIVSEQQGDEQAVATATIEAEIVDVKTAPADDDGEDVEGRSKSPALKARVAKPRHTKTEPADGPAMTLVRGKDGVVRAIAGGKVTVRSADGRTFEIFTSGGPAPFLHEKGKDEAPDKPAGRSITILRTADGESRVVEVDRIDGLINDLTLRSKSEAAEAPKFIIGVSVSEAPEVLMVHLGRNDDSAVVVDSVLEESPAAQAGVKKFDVILKAAGEPVRSAPELTKAVKASDGKALELVLLRAGKELTVEITPRPNEPVKTRISDGTIHIGPAVMERRLLGWAGEGGPASLHEEMKGLRQDVAELKKMLEELKAEK